MHAGNAQWGAKSYVGEPESEAQAYRALKEWSLANNPDKPVLDDVGVKAPIQAVTTVTARGNNHEHHSDLLGRTCCRLGSRVGRTSALLIITERGTSVLPAQSLPHATDR